MPPDCWLDHVLDVLHIHIIRAALSFPLSLARFFFGHSAHACVAPISLDG